MSALDLDIEPEVCIVNQKARRYHVYAYSESEEGHSAAEPDEYLYMFGMEYDDSGGACMRGTCRSTAVSGDFKICFSKDDVKLGSLHQIGACHSQRESFFLWPSRILQGVH